MSLDIAIVKEAWDAFIEEGNYSVLKRILERAGHATPNKFWTSPDYHKISFLMFRAGLPLEPLGVRIPKTPYPGLDQVWYPFETLSVLD